MSIASSSWLSITLHISLGTSVACRCPMACKGIVKVQLRICDNHSRSFTGADVPNGPVRLRCRRVRAFANRFRRCAPGNALDFLSQHGKGAPRASFNSGSPRADSNR